jgi:UDP-3-O-[3-hydroxymyristoyl] N-acetylglucosamine deacetylase
MNNQLLRALLARPDAWEVVSFEQDREAPQGFSQLASAW